MHGASPLPFWLDRPRSAEAPPLEGEVEADLAIVGAGFTARELDHLEALGRETSRG